MASSRRERDPGGTPGRADRPRLEDRTNESLSSGDDVGMDAAWHEQKEVLYVPVGETFEVESVLFKRTRTSRLAPPQRRTPTTRQASLMRPWRRTRPRSSYRRSSRTTPTKPGESYYATRAVKVMGLPLEYRKTTVRVGSGGGRVAGVPLCNVRRGDDIDVSTLDDDMATATASQS